MVVPCLHGPYVFSTFSIQTDCSLGRVHIDDFGNDMTATFTRHQTNEPNLAIEVNKLHFAISFSILKKKRKKKINIVV